MNKYPLIAVWKTFNRSNETEFEVVLGWDRVITILCHGYAIIHYEPATGRFVVGTNHSFNVTINL